MTKDDSFDCILYNMVCVIVRSDIPGALLRTTYIYDIFSLSHMFGFSIYIIFCFTIAA